MMAALATTAMTLGELLGSAAGAARDTQVVDLVLDSRQVRPGAAFVAVQGTHGHGLDHAADALARGAEVVVYEPSAEHPAPAAPSVAVPALKERLGSLRSGFLPVPGRS